MPAQAVIGFVSPVLRAALATLEAQLPDQIAAFNADPANTVDLLEPVAYVYGADDPLGAQGFPIVEVAATQGAAGQASIGVGSLGSDFDHYPVVTVVVWHEGDRGELSTTYEMSLGLAKCAIECLVQADSFGPGTAPVVDANGRLALFWRTDVIPADPTADNRDFRKWRVPVLLQFTVQAVEQFASP